MKIRLLSIMVAAFLAFNVSAETVMAGDTWSAQTPLFDDSFYNTPFLEFEAGGDYILTVQNLGLSLADPAPSFDQIVVTLFSFEAFNPLNASVVTTIVLDTLNFGFAEINELVTLNDQSWGSYRIGIIGQAANNIFGNAGVVLAPVPLPMPILLLGSALGALFFVGRGGQRRQESEI